jgi:hypothetical protein
MDPLRPTISLWIYEQPGCPESCRDHWSVSRLALSYHDSVGPRAVSTKGSPKSASIDIFPRYGCSKISKEELRELNEEATSRLMHWMTSLPAPLQVNPDDLQTPYLPHVLLLQYVISLFPIPVFWIRDLTQNLACTTIQPSFTPTDHGCQRKQSSPNLRKGQGLVTRAQCALSQLQQSLSSFGYTSRTTLSVE